MRIPFEYGEGVMEADLPDGNTEVFIPGETVPDPPYLRDPVSATQAALENPYGMPPIPELVRQGSRVVIVFPDRVKGGSHPTSHRKVAIPLIIEECLKAGVKKKGHSVDLFQWSASQKIPLRKSEAF